MNPEACPYERTTIKFGRRLKTCCTYRSGEIWVECKEYGRCHWAGREAANASEPEQTDSECERRRAKRSGANDALVRRSE